MPQVDFTKAELLEELKQVFATKVEMNQGFAQVLVEIGRVKKMLEEDARAESRRLDRVERRSVRTQRLLAEHLRDVAASGGR